MAKKRMPVTKKNAITSSWYLVSSTEGPTANSRYRLLKMPFSEKMAIQV